MNQNCTSAKLTANDRLPAPLVLVDSGLSPIVISAEAGIDPAAYRLWLIARAIDAAGSGVMHPDDLYNALPAYGVTITPRHYNRLVGSGLDAGLWHWQGSVLALTSQAALWQLAAARTDRIDTSPQRRVQVNVSGELHDFKASLYNAYLSSQSREGQRRVIVSRERLTRLFGVSVPTLIRWEQAAGVTTTPHFVQYNGDNPDMVPTLERNPSVRTYTGIQDGKPYAGKTWQGPNVYHPQIVASARSGRLRKIRKAFNAVISKPCEKGAGTCYTDDYRKVKRLLRKGRTVNMVLGLGRAGYVMSEPIDPVLGFPTTNADDCLFVAQDTDVTPIKRLNLLLYRVSDKSLHPYQHNAATDHVAHDPDAQFRPDVAALMVPGRRQWDDGPAPRQPQTLTPRKIDSSSAAPVSRLPQLTSTDSDAILARVGSRFAADLAALYMPSVSQERTQ